MKPLKDEIYGWLQDHGPAKNYVIREAMKNTPPIGIDMVLRVDRALQALRKEGKISFSATTGWGVVRESRPSPVVLDAMRWLKLRQIISRVGSLKISVDTIDGEHRWEIEGLTSLVESKGKTLEDALDVLEVPK